ncbi:hypothetical protein GCM10010170_047010 [Dactylosporangium salmoneum]|uniref:Uncharacterized protein n=1 Tax=Dactylosporangium salmoneum TaxID=53361 RepID=A0ABN3GLB6_9ACTN
MRSWPWYHSPDPSDSWQIHTSCPLAVRMYCTSINGSAVFPSCALAASPMKSGHRVGGRLGAWRVAAAEVTPGGTADGPSPDADLSSSMSRRPITYPKSAPTTVRMSNESNTTVKVRRDPCPGPAS